MSIKFYIKLLLKNLKQIILITLLFVILSILITTVLIPKKYVSTINIFINGTNTSYSSTFNNSDFLMYEELVETYGQLGISNAVINDIINKLDLNITENNLKSMISYQAIDSTQFLNFTVTSSNKTEAEKIANQLGYSLEKISSNINKNQDNYVNIIDPATPAISTFSSNIKKNVFASFILGLFISIGFILLKYRLDTTVQDEYELSQILNTIVIGSIPLT